MSVTSFTATGQGYPYSSFQLINIGAAVDARTPAGKTALRLAVEAGKLDVVRALSARADVQALLPDSDQSVLHLACHERANEIVMELLRAGGDPDAPDTDGVTPLMIAVRSNMVHVVKEMIDHGAKPPASATLGLIEHCRCREMKDMLEVVLASGWVAEGPLPSLSGAPDRVSVPLGSTRVHRVVHAEPGLSVRRCIPSEFEPSEEDSLGCTALHLAAQAGNLEILAELLIGRGKRGAASARGVIAEHLAAEADQAKIVDTSRLPESSEQADKEQREAMGIPVDVQDAEGQCPLHYAASNGQTEAMALLLEARAVIDCRDRNRRTPLHVAAKKGEVEAVELLLCAGASFEVRDCSGCSPLSEAMVMKKDGVVDALLAAGASACSSSVRGETPLHEACRRRPSVIPALIRAGAQAGHCWNEFSRTPLHVAAQAGQVEAAKQLLPLLSLRQINLRDWLVNAQEGGDTALLVAVRNRHVEMVELLLGAGADPKVSAGSSKLSPLHVATSTLGVGNKRESEARIVGSLIAAGADVHEVAPNGMTPLHAACLHGGREESIRRLLDAGADVSSPCLGYKLFLPVLLAACVGNTEGLRVLVKSPRRGVIDSKGPAPYRFTSLSLAVKHGHAKVVRVLLEEGADMEALPLGEQGDSPEMPTLIHIAASLGHGDIVSLLLQAMLLKEHSMLAT